MEFGFFHIATILVFIMAYLAIVFEHPLKLDKTVSALLAAALTWALVSYGFQLGELEIINGHGDVFNALKDGESARHGFELTLQHHLGKTAEILFFLVGAMTIVEIIDLHRGFEVLKGWIKTNSKRKLLWIIGTLAFVLSAVIDNLTATIVLVTLLRKVLHTRKERLWFAALVVIAANAGGAWSPIGDVTTTMLWIGHKTSALKLIEHVLAPAIICFVVPTLIIGMQKVMKGNIKMDVKENVKAERLLSSKPMLFLGLGAIAFVPIFKTVTHLPPYLGMVLGLSVVWMVSEYIHPEEQFTAERRHLYSAHTALSRIEMSSILFFLGILLAVGALESIVIGNVGALQAAAQWIDHQVPNQYIVVTLLGFLSAIIDNVPLVAAAMGMYDFPIDHALWHYIAYSAGTGGSMLIIGSAAGVAAMGMEKIDFIWYFKKISWIAFLGFIAGALFFVLQVKLGFV